MLRIRGLGSVRISKVKGHADEAMVRTGTVCGLDKLGNDGADEAAEFGRRRVPWWIIDARRNLSGICSRWRPLVLVLHRFFIAISRAVVNHGGGVGTAIDPLVRSAGSAPKRRRVAVRNRAFLPGPLDLWVGSWISGCRLRHIGWERCGHGLTSRPRESSSEDFLDKLLVLFGYPDRSAAASLAGDLPLRYCSARFAWKLPTWRLPDGGRVREFVTEGVDGARVIGSDGGGWGFVFSFCWSCWWFF